MGLEPMANAIRAVVIGIMKNRISIVLARVAKIAEDGIDRISASNVANLGIVSAAVFRIGSRRESITISGLEKEAAGDDNSIAKLKNTIISIAMGMVESDNNIGANIYLKENLNILAVT